MLSSASGGTVVCLVGLLPEPNITGPALVRHVLKPLQADLLVVTESRRALATCPELAGFPRLRGVASPARVVVDDGGGRGVRWWSVGTRAFLGHHEVCHRLLREAERKRSDAGGLRVGDVAPSWRRSNPYARVILTRGDFYWLQDHPPLQALLSASVWTPSRFSVGGLNDRHGVINRSVAGSYLQVLSRAEAALRGPEVGDARPTVTSEKALAVALRGLDVRTFPFAAHHVVPRDRLRAGAWGVGLGGRVKRGVSHVAQLTLSHAPASCEVSQTLAYSSEDVLLAHAAAACFVDLDVLAPLCGPYGHPQLERLDDCAKGTSKFTARFLSEGMNKPGLAGFELFDAATEARKAVQNWGPVVNSAKAQSFLEAAVRYFRHACGRTWVCERGRGENGLSIHCPTHFCSALSVALLSLGKAEEATAVHAATEASKHTWGLDTAPGQGGALRCKSLPALFNEPTVVFQNKTYCLVA
eukprot:TRINITY_DN67791_c0_g1_i1.p1 TRINITY_DN67791_c0_g1~~TRINITY_DN67791_c0_g1_i1.p1  ORF type:complete len:471 (-),score=47.08 TRINITY_DN67791_c0_g1_i1:79-1491(-)